MSTMQPLRDEHEELRPHIETIRAVADGVGSMPILELRPQIADVTEFLKEHPARQGGGGGTVPRGGACDGSAAGDGADGPGPHGSRGPHRRAR
jgi:hypothetical protein